MKRSRRVGWLVAFSLLPILAFGHGSFQCLAELESRTLGFASCSQTGLVCDTSYQSFIEQMSACREAGFSGRAIEAAIQQGYAQVLQGDAVSVTNRGSVSGRQLSVLNNWHRFRQTFGGFFDHDQTLLSVGFGSERCGNDVEGGSDSVHWVARLTFHGVGRQAHQWDFFEAVEAHRCYARTPDTLLVANIPRRFLKFYKSVWMRAFPNNRAVECKDREECQSYIEEKNRQFLQYRALLSAHQNWDRCNVSPGQPHCRGENWRSKIVELERERDRVWQLITQLRS